MVKIRPSKGRDVTLRSGKLGNYKELVDIYSYTPLERDGWPLYDEYMSRIEPRIPQILMSKNGRVRFALAGLFHSYRKMNHMGGCMSEYYKNSGVDSFDDSDLDAFRVRYFTKLNGCEIRSTRHYLHLISFGILMALRFRFGGSRALVMLATGKKSINLD